MKKIIIIGGGLSGLSTAVYLIDKGFKVEILEASPKLGGRTYSFNFKESDTVIDNGQHLLMGCYGHTLDYIDKIGSKDNFHFQDSLNINYVTADSKICPLSVPKTVYPFNFLFSFLNFKLLTFNERKEVLKFLFRINAIQKKNRNDISVKDLLEQNGQSESTVAKFWNLVVISAMNTPIDIASAKLFIDIIKIIFFSGKGSSNIILPKVGLSEALINPAEKFVLNRGGEVSYSERILKFEFNSNMLTKIVTSERIIEDFDYVVSAIPADNLLKIIPDDSKIRISVPTFEYSPILSVNLWLSENPLKEKFYGMIGGSFHWLFNKGEYISLIKSTATDMINLNKNELIKLATMELNKFFSILTNKDILQAKIIKERKATIISDSNSVKLRNEFVNCYNNFLIAGDWINTGLPGTIESSIKSGKMVVDIILSQSKK